VIDSRRLLDALRRLLRQLEDDLRQRIEARADLDARLRAEWQAARDTGRVGASFADWREEEITQAAAHWVLACVFLRFLEDNRLVERPYLSGATKTQRDLAQDRHEQFFRRRPTDSDREYLLACFEEVAALPALRGLFDPAHNPLWRLGLSGDGAMALLGFWRAVDPDTGQVLHDFTDLPPSPSGRGAGGEGLDTRFLGDLYQDLSEPVRKKYALLQTPVFVEEFILDRTLTPALADFGYREVRLLDPTCGSGHFLLGGFRRLFDLWAANEPARNLPDLAQRALDAVYGVDLNPYAVAIARFRLTIAALAAAGVRRLADAPDFQVHVAVGDSLQHGRRFAELALGGEAENLAHRGFAHAYATEDLEAITRILGQQYHVVVGNPPYITVKDPALNALYRHLYATCHMKYSLVAPFTERFFDLALPGRSVAGRWEEGLWEARPRADSSAAGNRGEGAAPTDAAAPAQGAGPTGAGSSVGAGYVGLIAANSFMKREFGKKLVEDFLPRVDLTHVIDTSGAYIPGHGTPTVILFGRNRSPVGTTVRTVMGIKGEPTAPEDPATGVVWSAILAQVDRPGSEGEFVSVADTPRVTFAKHPWSIGGGGASDLRLALDERAVKTLSQMAYDVGFGAVTREDDAYLVSHRVARRHGIEPEYTMPLVEGEDVRDWSVVRPAGAIWPYDHETLDAIASEAVHRLLWPYRTQLSSRVAYGLSQLERGLRWYEYSMFFKKRFASPLTITFAFVATHNHFVLDRGGKVFNRTAPVIKLPAGATEDDHLALLGLLNSSTACFWMQQVFHNKGRPGADTAGADERFEMRYEHDGTKLAQFPLVEPYPTDLARRLDALARELSECLPAAVLARAPDPPEREDP